ncbi:MAG: hypothetical protein ACRDLB_09220 [Actinomycetota bacterium]
MDKAQAVTTDNSCQLQVSPEVSSQPVTQARTLTATLENGGAGACADASGFEIDWEFESGPVVTFDQTTPVPDSTGPAQSDADNSPTTPDQTCTVPTGGPFTCQITFSANSAAGTNIIRAWVDDDKNNNTVPPGEGDATEGRYAGGGTGAAGSAADCRTPADDPQGGAPNNNATTCQQDTATPGARTEPDDTDVVQTTHTQALPAACVDAEPETKTNPSGTDHTINAQLTNSNVYSTSDQPGTFDCAGSPLANTNIVVTIQDDVPDVFIKSVNGTATGGPTGGGPNTVTAATDTNGFLAIVVACVSPAAANCTGANDTPRGIDFQAQGTNNGPSGGCGGAGSCDSVNFTWSPGGAAAAIDASPNTDTNEVGSTHTITCRIVDGNGVGVANQNCDAQITAGPNSTVNVDNNGATPNGYIGQCTTDANGNCTLTYTSSVAGTDTIRVFFDANGNDVDNGGGEFGETISKTWVLAGQGTTDIDIDMVNLIGHGPPPPSEGSDCNDVTGIGTDDGNDDPSITAPTHATNGVVVCAERFGADNFPDTGAIIFRIVSGPGSFFNDINFDGIKQAGEADLGAGPISRDEGCGSGAENCIGIVSNTQGQTVVEAAHDNVTATGTINWGGGAARNLACTPDGAEAEPGTRVVVTCHATDRNANNSAGTVVNMTITGPAEWDDPACFGANTQFCALTTGADGRVSGTLRGTGEGLVTVANEIAADTGDNDTPQDLDDSCDQPANDPDTAGAQPNGDPGAPAGNCEDNATVTFEEGAEAPECSDGVDNDGDGFIDFSESQSAGDPGCDSADDTTEDPDPAQCQDAKDNDGDGKVDTSDPGCSDGDDNSESPDPTKRIDSDIRNFTHNSPFKGRVQSKNRKCEKRRKVIVKRVGGGRVGKDRTDRSGNFRVKHGRNLRDGRYFAKVKKKRARTPSGRRILCRSARSQSIRVR